MDSGRAYPRSGGPQLAGDLAKRKSVYVATLLSVVPYDAKVKVVWSDLMSPIGKHEFSAKDILNADNHPVMRFPEHTRLHILELKTGGSVVGSID